MKFPEYNIKYISNVMSLRKPQKTSLEILENCIKQITENEPLSKSIDLTTALQKIKAQYPTCSDFERDFISLTFALATGVGKTRLMAAFIAYLYTNHNIKNFFIVAPSTTIFDKLKREFSDPSHPKYVFGGLGCFVHNQPDVISDEDYKSRQIEILSNGDSRIFIYNIDKFNKDNVSMKKVNEVLGDAFYDYLAKLDDLVILMDESHHYRAEQGIKAINKLNPLLGLELTATPIVTEKSKQTKFKNVVFEYPLSQAIKDGYTRTPYAMTRADINFYRFGEENTDKMMLQDGVAHHEETKNFLHQYAVNQSSDTKIIQPVKPFVLVVCKDTTHAEWVDNYVRSNEFFNGKYRNKVITVHSKRTDTTDLLLEVEKPNNPIEIVIHVNMLKEGWDVNNLYTIIPLRTATSKILREQMIGRGLRLPYGKRTGNAIVDRVMLTAHDKFSDIVKEAQKGDSIFNQGNLIEIDDHKEQFHQTQIALDIHPDTMRETAYQALGIKQSVSNDHLIEHIDQQMNREVLNTLYQNLSTTTQKTVFKPEKITQTIIETVKNDKDLGEIYKENQAVFSTWITDEAKKKYRTFEKKFIPIPKIKITSSGIQEYGFHDFDIDVSQFNHTPTTNDIMTINLINASESKTQKGNSISLVENPKKAILAELRKKPEIDYDSQAPLIQKLITQVCYLYEKRYGETGLKNIVTMWKYEIATQIYEQMMKDDHFYCKEGFIQEEVIGTRQYNLPSSYNFQEKCALFDNHSETLKITSILFTDIKKGVFPETKFDSSPELELARILEREKTVLKWLRPAPNEFNITYDRHKKYEPDFVVETENHYYLVEVKAEKNMNDPDVLAKSEQAVSYCKIASNWCRANNYKEWNYILIPHTAIKINSTFEMLAKQFIKQ